MRTLALLTLLAASSAFAAVDHEKAFKADIAPILEKSCSNCHDAKKAKNGKVKAGFDITSLAAIVKGGKDSGAGITWGDASKSSLYKSCDLGTNNPESKEENPSPMPPKKSQEKNPALTKEQLAKLKAFIEAK